MSIDKKVVVAKIEALVGVEVLEAALVAADGAVAAAKSETHAASDALDDLVGGEAETAELAVALNRVHQAYREENVAMAVSDRLYDLLLAY